VSRITVQLSGARELGVAIGEITARMSDAATRKAVRAAARPIITQTRANLAALPLDDSTGLLRRSIGVKVKKYGGRRAAFVASARGVKSAGGGVTVAIIGPRKGFGAYVSRRVDFGVKQTAEDVAARAALARDAANTESLSRTIAGGDGRRSVYSDPVKYAHLIERGVRPHQIGKGASLRYLVARGAQHPGFGARPWLLPAIESRRAEAEQIMARVYREELAKEAARARARSARRAA
jgi:hypothetical protein